MDIDGKYSFENAILPVPEFQQRYGAEIALLGGVDVHVLSSAGPDEFRQHVRDITERLRSSGPYRHWIRTFYPQLRAGGELSHHAR